jgi:hypothetical protein
MIIMKQKQGKHIKTEQLALIGNGRLGDQHRGYGKH